MRDRSLRPVLPDAVPALRVPHVERARLANGLELLHVERHGLPIVDVRIMVRGGAELDPDASVGLASLMAELLEEGTVTRTGYEIADGVDRLGASLSIRPGWDETTVALHILSARLAEGIDIAADVVRNATFPENEVRRRRAERLAALTQDLDEPSALVSRALATAVYGDAHPYGRSPTGTRTSVDGIDRDALVAFHAERFRPDATCIISVGDIDAATITGIIESGFGGWHGSAAPAGPPAEPRGAARPGIHLVDRPSAAQSEMRIGGPGPARATDAYAALVVLNTVLGGAFTSRLNLKLREEKGFTYGARSVFAFRRSGGPFVAGAAVATEATAEAIADTVHEIRRLREERVPPAELDRARRYHALGLPRRLETPAAMAMQLADLHLHGMDASELARFPERIAAVSADDVRDAACRWLDVEHMAIAVVGDAAAIRPSLEALGLGPVHDHRVVI